MTAKEFLWRATLARKRIAVKEERIEQLAARATKVTQSINGMPSGGRVSKDDVYAALLDEKDELFNDIIALARIESDVYKAIGRVSNPYIQMLLEERYIVGMSWEDIADSIGYDVRTIYRLHGQGLAEIAEIIKDVS